MSINLLENAELYNLEYTGIPQTQQELTQEEMKILVGLESGSVTLGAQKYLYLYADLYNVYYCESLQISAIDTSSYTYFFYRSRDTHTWTSTVANKTGTTYQKSFVENLPDLSRQIKDVKVLYVNASASPVTVSGLSVVAVDYPVEFFYTSFEVAASSKDNAPIKVYNNSIDGQEKTMYVLPVYTGEYLHDSIYMITASGRSDTNRYHINRAKRIPEDVPWEHGTFENTEIVDKKLQLEAGQVSGTWTSPVIYLPDDTYVSLYVYGEDLSDTASYNYDWDSINNIVEIRASDEMPLPYFLINTWNYQMWTTSLRSTEELSTVPIPYRRPPEETSPDIPSPVDQFWYKAELNYCDPAGTPKDYVNGRSRRIFMQGDGTVICAAPSGIDSNEYLRMEADVGIPFKMSGDINDSTCAAIYCGILGSCEFVLSSAPCSILNAADPRFDTFLYASLDDTSEWDAGRSLGDSFGVKEVNSIFKDLYPFTFHGYKAAPGVGTYGGGNAVSWDYLGATTFAIEPHPNDWACIVSMLYPRDEIEDKYMEVYLFNIRNFWMYKKQLIATIPMGVYPADEGFACCKTNDGFWVHAGYAVKEMYHYTYHGRLIDTYEVDYGFNSIESTSEGIWGIRNDRVYWYRYNGSSLVEVFNVYDDDFVYIKSGGVDAYGNLWLIDRDSSVIYRVNLENRSIDFKMYVEYAIGIWPHPTNGEAYVYVSFHPDTFSTAIKRVNINDSFRRVKLVATVPSAPLSDTSGVDFKGKVSTKYMVPGNSDPIWGTDENVHLAWQHYPVSNLKMPEGDYKQIRVTLRRDVAGTSTPKITKIRAPEALSLDNVPWRSYQNVYVNPHLRYDIQRDRFSSEMIVWCNHV